MHTLIRHAWRIAVVYSAHHTVNAAYIMGLRCRCERFCLFPYAVDNSQFPSPVPYPSPFPFPSPFGKSTPLTHTYGPLTVSHPKRSTHTILQGRSNSLRLMNALKSPLDCPAYLAGSKQHHITMQTKNAFTKEGRKTGPSFRQGPDSGQLCGSKKCSKHSNTLSRQVKHRNRKVGLARSLYS